MKCPMSQFNGECGADCEWYVRDHRTGTSGCVLVVLSRELAILAATVRNIPDKKR